MTDSTPAAPAQARKARSRPTRARRWPAPHGLPAFATGLPERLLARGGGRAVVQAWLLSRGLICLVALLLALTQQRTLTSMVSNWDVQHFSQLAQGGYLSAPNLMAFFPGLPGLLALGLQLGIPVAVSGVVLSTIGSAFAAAALARLGGQWAAIAWLFAPTAVFTTVPYTESLFCAAAFWAWDRARSDRWLAAACLTALACTLRVSGLFLIGALFVMIITTRKIGWSARLRRTALLIIPASVLAAFVIFLYLLTGSWTAWFAAQESGWARGFTWPWQSFLNTLPAIEPGAYADHPGWAEVFRFEMASMALGVVVTVWCLVRRLWAEASWVAVQVLAFSMSYWFFSVNRAVLLWFPLWLMVASWGTWQPRRAALAIMHRVLVVTAFTLSVLIMLWWCWLFFTGHWAS
ncbi:hypothetical protein [Microlunatus parietis]|uniref:Mannosyltransferase (PIG-V) n=1 Tax=Microlunatus parietis TaxID=682979 RepID=A0A7Y9LCQ3_9ACTN|nr:hypothetical protein [Microlunatus parietis]NYE72073.1 hypothetical protein [Microlunatus parietis]